jgi:hypothetical protein
VYDARTGHVVAQPDADWPPQHMTFAGELAYVTSGWSGTVRVHRVTGEALRRNPVPVGSYNVQAAAGRVLTPSLGHGRLTVLDRRASILYDRKSRAPRTTPASSETDMAGVPRP